MTILSPGANNQFPSCGVDDTSIVLVLFCQHILPWMVTNQKPISVNESWNYSSLVQSRAGGAGVPIPLIEQHNQVGKEQYEMDDTVNDVGSAARKRDHGHQGGGHEQDRIHRIKAQYNLVSGYNADDEDDRHRQANCGKCRTQADIDGAL